MNITQLFRASVLSLLFSFLCVAEISAQKQGMITIKPMDNTVLRGPLQKINISTTVSGKIIILDGNGDQYFSSKITKNIQFITGAALGNQTIILTDNEDRIIDTHSFKIDGQTEINDSGNKYHELLDILYKSMTFEFNGESVMVNFEGKHYQVFIAWLRDHVHALKGMKYFYPKLKSGIDLYGDSQRKDGMIWDNYTHKYNKKDGSYWVQRFKYGDFVRTSEKDGRLFTRIPAENDVEYLFIEGLYYTWKASGDNEWMKSMLDKALLAINYSTTSNYRWSKKYQLLKRAFTVDTWDFQNEEDAAISTGPNNHPDPMVVKEDYTRFGVMFGDNTGMAASCQYLSEMLHVAGREEESKKIATLGQNLTLRINKLSWNGDFFTHHVAEDTTIIRDLGVDLSQQISLSNAYSINRNIEHSKAVNIIKTYQNIRKNMPPSSPGEFYTIYPPFNKGFGEHNLKWRYVNGGVTSIVAGELAHGAFEHGYEKYGVDILDRLLSIAKVTDDYLHSTYNGKETEAPDQKFHSLSLKSIANADFSGESDDGAEGWFNEGDYNIADFPTGSNTFVGIPFHILDPSQNGRKACLGISSLAEYSQKARLEVNKNANAIYFLHTSNKDTYSGNITLEYADGTTYVDEIETGKIMSMWYPGIKETHQNTLQIPHLKVAWKGINSIADHIGVGIYGMNNPYPSKTIKNIWFNCSQNGNKWMVLGITLSDKKVYFEPSIISTGIPDSWGAAAVVYALVEGLVGIVDKGVAFDKITLSPRWEIANEHKVNATIKYPASNGYVSYQYEKNKNTFSLLFTGTMTETHVRLLIPQDSSIHSLLVNGKKASYSIELVEQSRYAIFTILGKDVHEIKMQCQ